MDDIILIGDQRVKDVQVNECNEAFVDLSKTYPVLKLDHDRKYVQKESNSIFYCRRSVAEMLKTAENELPQGIHLLIKECYRPMEVQKTFFEGYSANLRKEYPEWSNEKVYDECSKLNAPIEVAPHTTGGAVDLILISDDGEEIDMGTHLNASPQKTNEAIFTNATNISKEAQANRKILIDVMTRVGFINYPTEWWHWSYGDKYWGLMTQSPAKYSSTFGAPPKS